MRGTFLETYEAKMNKNYKWLALALLWVAFFLQQGTRQVFSATLSSIQGSLGVTSYTPVLDPPQVAILGVCAAEAKARLGEDGQPVWYEAMGLSLTFDHRALDGAPAARFLQALCRRLEALPLLLAM